MSPTQYYLAQPRTVADLLGERWRTEPAFSRGIEGLVGARRAVQIPIGTWSLNDPDAFGAGKPRHLRLPTEGLRLDVVPPRGRR